MKPYRIARFIEGGAIVVAAVLLLLGVSGTMTALFGESGMLISRIGAAVVALAGIIFGRKYSVCPHCGKTVNVLSRRCTECAMRFTDPVKKETEE